MDDRIKQFTIIDISDPDIPETLRFDLQAYLETHPIEFKIIENATLFNTPESLRMQIVNTIGREVAKLLILAKLTNDKQIKKEAICQFLQGTRKVIHDLIYSIATGDIVC